MVGPTTHQSTGELRSRHRADPEVNGGAGNLPHRGVTDDDGVTHDNQGHENEAMNNNGNGEITDPRQRQREKGHDPIRGEDRGHPEQDKMDP